MANGGRIGGRNVPGVDGYSGIWTPNEIADATRKGAWPQDFPKTISGLTLWFAADRLTGFNDGDAVTTWPDLSGNGYDVTQATAGNKPLYKTNIFKGKPALLFDGGDDGLENTTVDPFTAGAARTVFAFAKSTAGASVFICFRRAAPVWCYWAGSTGEENFFTDGANGASNTISKATGAINNSAGAVLTIRAPGAGGTHTIRANGGNGVVSSGSTPASDSGTTGFYVGRREGTNGFMNGHIAEIIAYNSNLSDADCLKIERYLAIKYLDIAA